MGGMGTEGREGGGDRHRQGVHHTLTGRDPLDSLLGCGFFNIVPVGPLIYGSFNKPGADLGQCRENVWGEVVMVGVGGGGCCEGGRRRKGVGDEGRVKSCARVID